MTLVRTPSSRHCPLAMSAGNQNSRMIIVVVAAGAVVAAAAWKKETVVAVVHCSVCHRLWRRHVVPSKFWCVCCSCYGSFFLRFFTDEVAVAVAFVVAVLILVVLVGTSNTVVRILSNKQRTIVVSHSFRSIYTTLAAAATTAQYYYWSKYYYYSILYAQTIPMVASNTNAVAME